MATPPSINDLLELVKNGEWETLAEYFRHSHPVDIAELISAAPTPQQRQLFLGFPVRHSAPQPRDRFLYLGCISSGQQA